MNLNGNGNISFSGIVDSGLKRFHGDHLSTAHGSSFNSYLIRDEKTAIIDTVWIPHTETFLKILGSKINLSNIDYIVALHGEPDHSGALPELMQLIPGTQIVCTANGAKSLKGYYHQDWNFRIVKSGERLSLGSRELLFIEAAMLHWPDTMMCYLTGDNILFSSDVFGQHLACRELFDDKAEPGSLWFESMKYFANIIAPFSKKVLRKVEEFRAMNLPLNMICPAHGAIWKSDTKKIIDKYFEWASGYSEDVITIIYDTMYESTSSMAAAIEKGILSRLPNAVVQAFCAGKSDTSDLITEIFRSKAVLVGSPAINNGILPSISALLSEMRNLGLSGKIGAAFGSYGWSPAALELIGQGLNEAGFNLFGENMFVQWKPDEAALQGAGDFGWRFAGQLNLQEEALYA